MRKAWAARSPEAALVHNKSLIVEVSASAERPLGYFLTISAIQGPISLTLLAIQVGKVARKVTFVLIKVG